MQKKKFYTELAYLIGVTLLTLGTAMMVAADFGLSMIIAPAYILHAKISTILPFYTLGVSDYVLQTVVLIALMIMLKRVRISYLFTFVTAFFSSMLLDLMMFLVFKIPHETVAMRLVLYIGGLFVCAVGVSLQFRSYIPPAAYELFVKDGAPGLGIPLQKFKTWYDVISCTVAIILAFSFFGMWHFEGISIGTVLCALVNGTLIGWCAKFFDKHFEFVDGLSFRKYFSI